MIIPEGINQIEFYKAAKAKGIKVKSKYKGVYIGRRNKVDICWLATLFIEGIHRNYTFPFTEKGELEASQQANRLREEKNKTRGK